MPTPLNILLVEDDENKRLQLITALNEMPEVGRVLDVHSYKSGLRELISGSDFDLVMLDMTLPMFDVGPDEPGGATRLYAGRDLLRQMQKRALSAPVVVVTQYTAFGEGSDRLTLDELDVELRGRHPRQYIGHVSYDAVQVGWRRKLSDIVKLVAGTSI